MTGQKDKPKVPASLIKMAIFAALFALALFFYYFLRIEQL